MDRSLFLFRRGPSIPILWAVLFLTWSMWGDQGFPYTGFLLVSDLMLFCGGLISFGCTAGRPGRSSVAYILRGVHQAPGESVARQNCSLAWSRVKFILSRRNLFGPRRCLAGGVPASSNRRRKREEQDEASGLLNLQVNRLTPNNPYMCRTAPLTSKCCILYIYSTNIGTEYFQHALYPPFFSLQNAVCFIMLTCWVPVLFTFDIQGVIKIKKIIPVLKG
jgi:hypothetical protein